MSQTVIFSVGVVIYAITVVGAIMSGGIWLGGRANEEASPEIRRERRRQIEENEPPTD